jgi:hypothetical protein
MFAEFAAFDRLTGLFEKQRDHLCMFSIQFTQHQSPAKETGLCKAGLGRLLGPLTSIIMGAANDLSVPAAHSMHIQAGKCKNSNI